MKKALLTLMCLTAMMVASTSLKAQEVTIVLTPGWNWISHPSTDTVDFATAFGSFTPATGDVIKSRWGQAFYTNNRWMGSISQFYPGYGYMYKSNRMMPVMVTFNVQQPAPSVVVTTSEPLLITAISAMGGGEVTVSDGTYILVKGLCWATHENPTTNDDFYQEAESGVGSFSLSMTGLNISTTYYVRAYAVTGNGTVYGDQKTFTTRDGIPTLATDSVTDITGATATCGGNITDNGGLNVTARGVCWSTSPNPTIADSYTTNGSGSGSFSSSVTGLSVSTTYYVRAYATTNAGTAYGNETSFTTLDGIPTLTTTEITDITGTSATGGGNITDYCGMVVIDRGVCWSINPNPTINDSLNTYLTDLDSFNCNITGLIPNTTYYVRAFATTSAGTAYGNEVIFTTLILPTLAETEINYVDCVSAECIINIIDTGGNEISACGACWSTSPAPTVSDTHTDDVWDLGEGLFECWIGGLSPSTTYYVRAYATTIAGTGYGNEVSFTTLDGIPTLTTADVTDIYCWEALSGGTITDMGDCGIITACGVCWSTSPAPTISDSHTNDIDDINSSFFYSWLDDLSPNTTYYVRAYATTIAGTGYGNEVSFTTMDGIPTLTTANVSSIGTSWGLSGGTITDLGGAYWYNACGVCWSTSPNPTLNDSHSFITKINEENDSNFTSVINNLNKNTTYYVRAYATTDAGTGYGNEVVFTTHDTVAHDYVDLGLPSGLLWATCNIGATTPGERGYFFNWGGTAPMDFVYQDPWNLDGEDDPWSDPWRYYPYCNGGNNTFTKYCNYSYYGYNGYTDTLTILEPSDDVATVEWGGDWRMPTEEEWQELLQNTTITVSYDEDFLSGVVVFTASNGNSLLLPMYRSVNEGFFHTVLSGDYWSSSLDTYNPSMACEFSSDASYYGGSGISISNCARYYGRLVRPVRSGAQSTSFVIDATANPVEGGVVSGSGSYQVGAECMLTATANEGYTFTNWTENDEVVSVEATYTFTVDADRTLVANFTYNGGNAPTGAIDAKFTINVNGDQVYFSQGNLQYQASTNTWKFAENQWDYVGEDNANISQTYDGWIDLFGWGTSGYNHGANCYQPWSTSISYSDYYAYGSYTYNLYDQTGQADWGYNPISNGGNTANQWRTLTQPEWNYVFNTRTTTSGIRYAKANVNNVNGVILLPDDWNSSTYSLSNTNSGGASFSSNTLTISQWNTLEQVGAVFLPAAALRYGISVSGVGYYSGYWSAWCNDSWCAYYVMFNDLNVDPNYYNNRYNGLSVRLVTPAEN